MQKIIKNGTFTYDVNVDGASSVISIKAMVKPEQQTKLNKQHIEKAEHAISEFVGYLLNKSNFFSSNHIVDFDCTKENLNTEKWSRLKVDLYLFVPSNKTEEKTVEETLLLCEMVSDKILLVLSESGFIFQETTV